ncbi:MAG: S8 family serine peptidase [Verrucomicrobia bacterium]|nr:S8 family serine peptidase [Verrucomicrobiota bacterium]
MIAAAGIRLGIVLAALCLIRATAPAGPPAGPSPLPPDAPSLGSPLKKIAPQVLEELRGNRSARVMIRFSDRADLGRAKTIGSRNARLRFVYDELARQADVSQAAVVRILEARGLTYHRMKIVNAIFVTADLSAVIAVARRPEVRAVYRNAPIPFLPKRPFAWPEIAALPPAPSTVPWGIAAIDADDMWALGYDGAGITVAIADTGQQWDHPALINGYRGSSGFFPNHNYNWFDAIDGTTSPFDDLGHGTHVIGTVVGLDDVEQIGVAPGATWFGARNMENGWGTPESYISCWEFFIAPTDLAGNNPDPTKAPHIVVNSTYCPGEEGCDPTSLNDIVHAVDAAGIIFITAAGNNGPGLETLIYPPAIYHESFTVGAFDDAGNIASFSSRGPTTYLGETYLKPELAAPGVGIRSSVPGGGYGSSSGTSMASPHCAGTAALMLQAAPSLIGDPERIAWHLTRSAVPVVDLTVPGDDDGHPNAVWGWGKLNALNAVTGALDDDRDGHTNLEEQVAGTSATDPADRLRVTSVTPSGDDLIVVWTSVPGKQYALVSTTDPPAAERTWSVLQSGIAAGPGDDTSWTHTGALTAGGGKVYYRVVVEEND